MEFEFDCPSIFVDIQSEINNFDVDETWWTVSHELQEMPTAQVASSNRRTSILSKAQESKPASRQLKSANSKIVKEPLPEAVVKKTVVSIVAATAPIANQKAAVSHQETGKPTSGSIEERLQQYKQNKHGDIKTTATDIKPSKTSTTAASSSRIAPNSISDGDSVAKKRKEAPIRSSSASPPAVPLKQGPSRIVSDARTKATAAAKSTESEAIRPNSSQSTTRIKQPSGTTDNKGKTTAAATNATDSCDDMLMLLKKHNKRFAPIPAYEPPRHSVRDVRKWEKLTGKLWANLSQEEREEANSEIGKIKDGQSVV